MDLFAWEQLPEEGKEVPQRLRPEEEIAKFTVEEGISDLDRCVLYLTGGQIVQERKAIELLPQVVKARGKAAYKTLQSHVQQLLQKADIDLQEEIAGGLATITKERSLSGRDVAECVLPMVLGQLKKERSDEELEPWLTALREALPALEGEALHAQVLPMALERGQVNEGVRSRVLCCKLLGLLTPYLSHQEVCTQVRGRVITFCQDTDYQVRIVAAALVPIVARVIGGDAAKQDLLPELAELLVDEEVQVRVVALSALIPLGEVLPSAALKSGVVPLVRKHMQPLDLEAPVQKALATLFGQVVDLVRMELEPSDASLLYGCFRHLAARGDVELRRLCAAQLPVLMKQPLPGTSSLYLHDTWQDLAGDHDDQVRCQIAAHAPEVAELLGPEEAGRLLRKPLLALVKDTSAAVRQALLPGLPATLQGLISKEEDRSRNEWAAQLQQALLALINGLGASWRMQNALAQSLPLFPVLFGPEPVHDNWVTFAISRLTTGAASVKPAAAAGLAVLFRSCRKERQRTDLYCRFCRDLARGASCWARMGYVELCAALLPRFSCKFFKENFLGMAMLLLVDPVANVRLSAAALLPALKHTIRLPEDVELLEQMNTTMSFLITDTDRDVAQAARAVHERFKKTPLRVTGGAGVLDINGTAGTMAEAEAADKVKEAGEVDMTFVVEDMDRLKAEYYASCAEARMGRFWHHTGLGLDPGGLGSGNNPPVRKTNSNKAPLPTGSGSGSSAFGGGVRTPGAAAAGGSGLGAAGAGGGRVGAGAAGLAAAGAARTPVGAGSSPLTSAGAIGSRLGAPGVVGRAVVGSSASAPASSSPSPRTGGLFSSSSSTGASSSNSPPGSGSSPKSPATTASALGAIGSLGSPTGSSSPGNLRLPALAGSPKTGSPGILSPNNSALPSPSSSAAASAAAGRLGGYGGMGPGSSLSTSGLSAAAARTTSSATPAAKAPSASSVAAPLGKLAAPSSSVGKPGGIGAGSMPGAPAALGAVKPPAGSSAAAGGGASRPGATSAAPGRRFG